ncbi:helix-turn-helix domain-containing protein [Pseudomonas vancouverensis]|uniref:Helix-turn-helix transcriptional regulator n=1 Tax=Pseudomonas vancouverensis TaxID=95300 RepID=A0A1H2P7C6_PSEVA|nr:helix-turn-helix domain-containing protein [Pseudomonas vancouverensis]KAB0499961.1 helix-turn-helix transcriptional regulator [Pseudomonas vancouverensis]TDB68450.1 helix-turn-helix transcriptional regulator [Pseudomonas vancouverensis]SDV13281.1 LuxR family transcriptional regulator, quorum-sensing transcription factor LasR [Pseudomonas vancouverensis]
MSTQTSIDAFARTVSGEDANTPSVKLTARETQILLWCFKGKTTWEISRIENRSESTVNFHFANIRRKFAVNSRSAALLKAIETGALAVDSSERCP